MDDNRNDKLNYMLDYAAPDSMRSMSLASNSASKEGASNKLLGDKLPFRKLESFLRSDMEQLQRKYSDLAAQYAHTQQEVKRLSEQLTSVVSERNAAVKEKDGLQQQCSAAIRQWDKALRENNETREQLLKVQQQRDDALKKINQEMALRIKAAKDLSRLTEERNAAFQEYNLIMSERDQVHKEIERLSEELGEQQKKQQQCEQEKRSLMDELSQLKKDNLYAEAGVSHNRWGSSSSGIASSWLMMNASQQKYKDAQHFVNKHRLLSASNSSSVHSTSSHTRLPNQADEIEVLRKQIDFLQQELVDLQTDLGNSRRQCDQIQQDKEKVMQERESIRLLSDKLRRERDRAIRDLAEALRDLDDTRRQKCEVLAELNEGKNATQSDKNNSENENKENLCKNDSFAKNSLRSREFSFSEDSGELSDFELYEVKLTNKFQGFTTACDLAWGFELKSNDKHQVFVTQVAKSGPAAEQLLPHDMLLKVNSIPVDSENFCRQLLSQSHNEVHLQVRRRRPTHLCVPLQLNRPAELGLRLENVCIISQVQPGSACALSGRVQVGDILLKVNEVRLRSESDLANAMNALDNQVLLQLYRGPLRKFAAQCDTSLNTFSTGYEYFRKKHDTMQRTLYSPGDLYGTYAMMNQQANELHKPPMHLSTGTSTKKSSSRKNKEHLESNSFVEEKGAPTLLDRAYHKIFGKSSKFSKQKEEHVKQRNFILDEKETLDALDQVLDDYSSKKEGHGKRVKRSSEKEKDNGGTWPKYRPHTVVAFPTYKTNGTSTVCSVKKKERKSLSIYTSLGRQSAKEEPPGVEMASSIPKSFGTFAHDRGSVYGKNFELLQPSPLNETDNYKIFLNKKQYHGMISTDHCPIPLSDYANPLKDKNELKQYREPSISSSLSSYSFSNQRDRSSSNKHKYTVSEHHNQTVKFCSPEALHEGLPAYEPNSSSQKEKLYANRQLNRRINDQMLYSLPMEPVSPTSPISLGNRAPLNNFARFSPDVSMNSNRNGSYGIYGPSSHLKKFSAIQENAPVSTNIDRPSSMYYYTRGNVEQDSTKNTEPTSLSLSSYSPHFVVTAQPIITSGDPYALSNSRRGSSPAYDKQLYFGANKHRNMPPSKNSGLPSTSDQRYFITPSPSSSMYSNEIFCTSPLQSMEVSPHNLNRPRPIGHHSLNASGVSNFNPDGKDFMGEELFLNEPNNVSDAQPQSLDGMSTFGKRNQRIRISSNNSVNSKMSNCSIDKHDLQTSSIFQGSSPAQESTSGCLYRVEWLNRTIKEKSDTVNNIPLPGDIRFIYIEKNSEPLGIQIGNGALESSVEKSSSGSYPGIFISTVSAASLACQVGLQAGDQLLEICGINMRSANYDAAANVLRQCGNTISMKVQFNPDKYHGVASNSSFSSVASIEQFDEDSPDSIVKVTKQTQLSPDSELIARRSKYDSMRKMELNKHMYF